MRQLGVIERDALVHQLDGLDRDLVAVALKLGPSILLIQAFSKSQRRTSWCALVHAG